MEVLEDLLLGFRAPIFTRAAKHQTAAHPKIYYWRTRSGVEVDFLVYGEAGFWAIEVKNNRRVRHEDLGGLKSFAAGYPECKPLLLYRGQERLKIDRIQCLPVEDFLRDLKPSRRTIASK
jgi:predicted AAA+ superfamily ATPase